LVKLKSSLTSKVLLSPLWLGWPLWNMCNKWPRICSTFRKHFPVLSLFTLSRKSQVRYGILMDNLLIHMPHVWEMYIGYFHLGWPLWNMCNKWPRICSTFRKHFPVLSLFMTCHRICNYINTTGVNNGTGTAYPSGDSWTFKIKTDRTLKVNQI
jgi:hypothetical protein